MPGPFTRRRHPFAPSYSRPNPPYNLYSSEEKFIETWDDLGNAVTVAREFAQTPGVDKVVVYDRGRSGHGPKGEFVAMFRPDYAKKNPAKRAGGGKRIRITYEIVTPESAEHGDVEESGWIDEEGVPVRSVAEAARVILQHGPVEGDRWYTQVDADQDYATGADTRWSFHPVGFTAAELDRLHDLVQGD